MEKTRLFPFWVKNIGLLFGLCALILMLLVTSETVEMEGEQTKALVSVLVFIAVILQIVSKDRHESKDIAIARLKAMSAGFIVVPIFMITNPITNWIFDGTFVLDLKLMDIVPLMVFFYFFAFYLNKRKIKLTQKN